MHTYKIAASLLSANFAQLGEETKKVLEAGADWIHLDVMDNHYVPNLTVGPMVCRSLREYGITAPIDVHLMARPVDRLIADFAKAGATYISIHPEASDHLDRSLQNIRDHGCKAGLALNPATSLSSLNYVLDKLDMILIMSVNPGFANQTFIPSSLGKIREVRRLIDSNALNIRLEVDGGIKPGNIHQVAEVGADTFVVGSAIFDTKDYADVIANMQMQLNKTKLISHS
jgi:ribulose-phosphate 3-epimerase